MYLSKGMNGNFHVVGESEKSKPMISEKERRMLRIQLNVRMKVRRAKEAERREGYYK